MLTINLKADVSSAKRKLGLIQRSVVPSATRWAINETAKAVAAAEVKEMRRVFDRPTPYTLNAIRVRFAGLAKLSGASVPVGGWNARNTDAVVWLKDEFGTTGKGTPATKYLGPQIEGGARNMKRFEIALNRIGLLPNGMMAVPAAGADRDGFGNMKASQIVQILAYFRAFGEQGYKSNMDAKGRARLAKGSAKRGVRGVSYFVSRGVSGKTTHLPMGIWARTEFGFGSAIKPVLLFVKAPNYKRRFDFFGIANRVVKRTFQTEFEKAVASLIKSRGLG